MELQDAWKTVDFYLEHILARTKDLRTEVAKLRTVSETPDGGACIIGAVEESVNELGEALRLSRAARERIENLFSHRRKGDHNERQSL